MEDPTLGLLPCAALRESGLPPEAFDGCGVGLMPGDGMKPTIKENAPVIYRPGGTPTESGGIWVVRTRRPGSGSRPLTQVRRVRVLDGDAYSLDSDFRRGSSHVVRPTGERAHDGGRLWRLDDIEGYSFRLRFVGQVIYPTRERRPQQPLTPGQRMNLDRHCR